MRNVIFWDVMPCGSCKNQRFRGTNCLHFLGENNQWPRNTLAVTSNSSTLWLIICSGCYIPEDDILQSHCCGNLKSYIHGKCLQNCIVGKTMVLIMFLCVGYLMTDSTLKLYDISWMTDEWSTGEYLKGSSHAIGKPWYNFSQDS
jgi:hypothetical protein